MKKYFVSYFAIVGYEEESGGRGTFEATRSGVFDVDDDFEVYSDRELMYLRSRIRKRIMSEGSGVTIYSPSVISILNFFELPQEKNPVRQTGEIYL